MPTINYGPRNNDDVNIYLDDPELIIYLKGSW
jgi:hypothetical protein